jgi:hypothetical protein
MTSLRTGAAALAVGTALLASASGASAYCRTITAPLPADFDQTSGCYSPTGAIPLWWSNACVGFSVQQDASKQIDLADARTHSLAGFQRWMDATCPDAGAPSISVSDEGPVACSTVGYSETGPNQHVIIFRDSSWPHDDVYNTLALTTVTFNTDTGEIYDADVEVNTFQTQITVSATPAAGQYDYDSIITHEAGHFLGLAHSPAETAVMFAHYKPGSYTLTSDDVSGICSIYSPSGTRATEQDSGTAIVPVTVPEGTPCDPTPRHGFGSQCGPMGAPAASTSSGCTIAAVTGSGGAFCPVPLGALGALAMLAARRRRSRTAARVPSMKRLRAWAFGSLLATSAAGLCLAVEGDARASISIAVLFDELVRDSSAAAIVTPFEQKAVWEDGRIVTYSHVHADRTVAGSLESDPWIRTLGGTVGRVGQVVDGEASLTIGKSGLLFLHPDATGTGTYVVTARAQGQFPVIAPDAQGAQGQRAPIFRASAGVGGLVPTPDKRVAEMSQLRASAGLRAEAPRAMDVLHTRPVEDGVREVAAAWVRIHGSK